MFIRRSAVAFVLLSLSFSRQLDASPYRAAVSVVEKGDIVALSVSSPIVRFSGVLRSESNISPITSLSPRLFSGRTRGRGVGPQRVAGDIIGDTLRLWTISVRGRPVVLKVPLKAPKSTHVSSVAPSYPVRCGVGGATKVSAVIRPRSSVSKPVFSPVREMQVATLSDARYTAEFGSGTQSQIESVMNAVNSVYLSDIGIKVKIPAQRVLNSDADLTTNNSEDLLTQFRSLVVDNPISSQADTSHLFTGRDLSGSVVGLAYLGVVCFDPSYATGLSQRTTDALDWIITAHELGHNLNAEHTPLGDGIMSPSVSTGLTSFSSTSVNQITSFVNDAGSCLSTSSSDISLLSSFSAGSFSAAVSVTTTADPASCKVDLYASLVKKSDGRALARAGSRIASRIGETNPTFTSTVRNRARKSTRVYLAARSTCTVSGSEEKQFSTVKRISVKNDDPVSALRRSLR